ncbi:alpha/beta-hydrolase [Rhizodiscina lignyota]|uniref:Carboxylic ester hydrolase n=1 Tax=Rhizodiscina lignyota TaxID=1504668 RepID=A0A9P4MAK2_9PEZI|nr:alpha/beta-hydrolase [Rhizodiscina lignyota]
MYVTAAVISAIAAIAAFFARGSDSSPRVSISNGTVIGTSSDGVDTFLGIPYAQPPTDSLRLKRPQALSHTFGTIQATSIPRACPPLKVRADPQMLSQIPPEIAGHLATYFQEPTFIGEDCLTLNVQRPASVTPNSKLPVLVWIYGGGFEQGSTQQYDFARLVNTSIALEHPIIVVQMNWRVSAFGFLGGKELQQDGSTNLGLRDQRFALQWIAENIEAFGGDPSRVSIWGESGGSMSVFDHTMINGGDHTYNGKPLFRGAILNSGAVGPALPVDAAVAQKTYDTIVDTAGCSSSTDTLACLRDLPYEAFLNASNVTPNMFNQDGVAVAFTPRPDPSDNFFPVSPDEVLVSSPPKVAPVPILAGTMEDEGTLFALALYRAPTKDALIDIIHGIAPTCPRSTFERLFSFYPDEPSHGSPFGTGEANELYPGYKRNAAIAGDLCFAFQHRLLLEAVSDIIPTWSYLSTYGRQTPLIGTFHGADVALLATGFIDPLYRAMVQYIVSFVHHLDPNVISKMDGGARGLPEWPRYGKKNKDMMQFTDQGLQIGKDDFRQEAFNYFSSQISQMRW